MNLNDWYVKDNIFTKGFMDYVVEVKPIKKIRDFGISEIIEVTIWKGNGYEDTKHTVTYDNFEDAFNFVDEFSKQKFFDQVVEEYFNYS